MSYQHLEDDAREAALLRQRSREERLRAMTDNELDDALGDIGLYLSEIEADHGMECALYGDSWPGACVEIDSAHEELNAIEAEIERRTKEGK